MKRPRAVWLAGCAAIAIGCGITANWIAPDAPSPAGAEAVLTESSTEALSRRLGPTGIPDIPARKRLRPCCAFGYDLHVRVAFLPVFGFRVGNLKVIEEIGPHRYDSGVLMVGGDRDDTLVSEEHNGLVFTCRGGFIDTAHVRDYADWAIYLGAHLYEHLDAGVTIDLPSEGGRRRVRLDPVDAAFLRHHDSVALTMAMAQWLAFQLSVWHEVATWYGWSSTSVFSERVSAFSPEDLYSNALGTKIALATAFERSARSEALYDRSVDAWLREIVRLLGPTSKQTAIEAMQNLDGIWWDSTARLPDPGLVLRRNLSIGESLTPWLVPESAASESLKARLSRECGGWPRPLALPNPAGFAGVPLRTLAALEIRVDASLANQPPFDALGPVVTQDSFPAILEVIRQQNLREFGSRADRPH
jgi:hypothetical protein